MIYLLGASVEVTLGMTQILSSSEILHGCLGTFILWVGSVTDVIPLEVFLGRFLCQICLPRILMPHCVNLRVLLVGWQVPYFTVHKLDLVQHE